eukprot:CAMPEP_0176474990 /NCGR_PEP_ID=MMETSP0127-20121128/43351_1 /TAXON_ID=938130 /ORGANISM="Platyophrya macrostoma, Strain WH" /LENGTH=604 /DNA_ID=CAMNT_0017870523 /DNA_START=57 /DNA_END=1869 /DNA_ORIENTATION=+
MSAAPVRRGRGTFRCGLHSEGAASAVVPVSASSTAERFAFAFEKEKPIDIVGGGPLDATESARVQIFRRERRKRYIVIVGPLTRIVQNCQCKLFGHRGPKPLRLHQKWIRMLHLTIPKHKRLNALLSQQQHQPPNHNTVTSGWTKVNPDEQLMKRRSTTDQQRTHNGSGLDSGELAKFHDDVVMEEMHDDPSTKEIAEEHQPQPSSIEATKEMHDDPSTKEIAEEHQPQPSSIEATTADAAPHHSDSEDDAEDPASPPPPFEPLITTDSADRERLKGSTQHSRAYPVLWSRRFSSLSHQLRTELLDLWSLEDISKQRVELHLCFGTLYVCANSQRQESLEESTFPDMIGKLNDEAVQTHFIEDCPTSISRAVDACCMDAKVVGTRDYSLVKLTFFSQDKQSRSIARALWNGATSSFELTDVESIGVAFKWTILSLDERAAVTKSDLMGASNKDGPGKLVAFPVELAFRAFNRSKNVSEHAASREATIVLEKLTEVEQNMIRHGSSSQHLYEKMDLSSLVSTSSDYELESIQIEHIEQRKLANDLFIESASCLLIEGFNAPLVRRAVEAMNESDGEKPPLPLSFFRTRSNEIFWKMRYDVTCNPM